MTGWIVLGVAAVVLVCLLFGPIDARVRIEWPLRLDLRVTWFSIPIPLAARRKPRPIADKPRRKSKVRKLAALMRLRTGRALLEVAKTRGLFDLVLDLGRSTLAAVELVKADFVIAAGFGAGKSELLMAAVMSGVRPRFLAGQGRVRVEIAPALGKGFEFDGEIILRTRPWPWLVLGARVLCSRTLWRAWRRWKRETGDGD